MQKLRTFCKILLRIVTCQCKSSELLTFSFPSFYAAFIPILLSIGRGMKGAQIDWPLKAAKILLNVRYIQFLPKWLLLLLLFHPWTVSASEFYFTIIAPWNYSGMYFVQALNSPGKWWSSAEYRKARSPTTHFPAQPFSFSPFLSVRPKAKILVVSYHPFVWDCMESSMPNQWSLLLFLLRPRLYHGTLARA